MIIRLQLLILINMPFTEGKMVLSIFGTLIYHTHKLTLAERFVVGFPLRTVLEINFRIHPETAKASMTFLHYFHAIS